MQAAQRRVLERKGRDGDAPLLGALGQRVKNAEQRENEQDEPPPPDEEVAHGDEPLRHGRHLRAHLGEHIAEGRDRLDHDDDDDDDGDRNDHRGVGQRADDLGLGLGGLVVILVQALEAFLQRAGLLARAHGLDKGLGQAGHIVFKALRHGIARADILGDLFEHSARALVAALRGDHLHAAHHGQARTEDDGELRADERQLLFLDPHVRAGGKGTLFLLDLFELGDERAGVAQLGDRLELVVGTDDAGDLRPVDRLALVAVCRHALSPALRFFPKINTVMLEFYFVIVYDGPIAVSRPRWC